MMARPSNGAFRRSDTMNGFWEGGYEALEKGFRDEIARLEKQFAAAATPEEQQSTREELDKIRADSRRILHSDLIF